MSVLSTFPDHSRAGRSRGDMPARPGLNPLRFTTNYVTTKDGLEKLRAALMESGLGGGSGGGRGGDAAELSLNGFGTRVTASDAPGIHAHEATAIGSSRRSSS